MKLLAKFKHGDTLIEVALAIGIFSLVAIAVVAVVSASTASAQAALEITVTREEIDVQAEALRFIHDSYISGGQNETANVRYTKLWRALTASADANTSYGGDFLNFNPTTCREIYDNSAGPSRLAKEHAFIINPRTIGYIEYVDTSQLDSVINSIVLRPSGTDNGVFSVAGTYPRLLYGGATGSQDDNSLFELNDISNLNLTRAEGLFIVAYRDNNSTVIFDADNPGGARKSAYYDFYIRSCWFNPGADRPSTISTVVRLYDPSIIEY